MIPSILVSARAGLLVSARITQSAGCLGCLCISLPLSVFSEAEMEGKIDGVEFRTRAVKSEGCRKKFISERDETRRRQVRSGGRKGRRTGRYPKGRRFKSRAIHV